MAALPRRFPLEGIVLGVLHGQRDQWTFLVVAELGRIFHIDDDESWQRGAAGSRRRSRVDVLEQGGGRCLASW